MICCLTSSLADLKRLRRVSVVGGSTAKTERDFLSLLRKDVETERPVMLYRPNENKSSCCALMSTNCHVMDTYLYFNNFFNTVNMGTIGLIKTNENI